jgi:diadenosine tetraphosphate (Ap4A) HIT family hydrolase
MDCPFCQKHMLERIFLQRDGWFAFLDANGMLPGHTILAREPPPGSCPQELTTENLAGVDRALPHVVAALKQAYEAYDVLVSSLRGTVKHVHFHLIPLTHAAERQWRTETPWEKGHLHEFLGHQEREGSLRNQLERIQEGWDEKRQMVEHTKRLQSEVASLRRIVGGWGR